MTPTVRNSTGRKIQCKMQCKRQCIHKLNKPNHAIVATDVQSRSAQGHGQSCESEHLPGGRNRAAAAMPLRFTSAMQTRTQDATPEPAKQTGCQRAPGKVQLRLDLIQRVPCYTMQPTRISRQNHRPTRPTTIPSAPPMLRLQLRFRNDCFAKHLQSFCNCNASKCNCTTFKATQLAAMQFQAMQSQAITQSRSRNQHLPTHTTASRCQSKCGFFKVSFRNSDGTKHSRHKCNPSATPLQS